MLLSVRCLGFVVLMQVTMFIVPGQGAQPPAKTDDPKGNVKNQQTGMPNLAAALKQTPGCLGVETARTTSGKQVIFAWFRDKQAALKWYHSDTHKAMKRQFPLGIEPRSEPLADVPDDSGPLMVVASLTMNPNASKTDPHPFKQIAIEVYRPLGEGLHIGGRFAPEAMKLPSGSKRDKH
jgi:quinol monooxygenase YgiN